MRMPMCKAEDIHPSGGQAGGRGEEGKQQPPLNLYIYHKNDNRKKLQKKERKKERTQ